MNPLQDLKDIHTPIAVESWPPAYGWWLLAVLIVLSICVLIIWQIKARKVTLAKRQALQVLQQIDGLNPDCVSQLNQILKRLAMTYFPKQNVQQMHSEKWTEFLVKTFSNKKTKDFSETMKSMQQALYQPQQLESAEFIGYQRSVETWIKHALPPSKSIIQQLEQKHA